MKKDFFGSVALTNPIERNRFWLVLILSLILIIVSLFLSSVHFFFMINFGTSVSLLISSFLLCISTVYLVRTKNVEGSAWFVSILLATLLSVIIYFYDPRTNTMAWYSSAATIFVYLLGHRRSRWMMFAYLIMLTAVYVGRMAVGVHTDIFPLRIFLLSIFASVSMFVLTYTYANAMTKAIAEIDRVRAVSDKKASELADLQKRLTKMNKELEVRNASLESLNSLIVGREMKMNELKAENESLKSS